MAIIYRLSLSQNNIDEKFCDINEKSYVLRISKLELENGNLGHPKRKKRAQSALEFFFSID